MANYGNKKGNTNRYKRIDVRYMQRKNLLNVGLSSSLEWISQRTGKVVGRVDYEVLHDGVRFKYNVRSNPSEAWRPYNYLVAITHTSCNYGGTRAWFNCPHCLKRVAVLYIDEQIACRTCHKLNYTSQQQTKGTWQERDRMNKVREKLGWPLIKDVSLRERIKPKGMHWKTFEKLCQEHDLYERRFLVCFSAGLDMSIPWD